MGFGEKQWLIAKTGALGAQNGNGKRWRQCESRGEQDCRGLTCYYKKRRKRTRAGNEELMMLSKGEMFVRGGGEGMAGE